MGGGVKKSENFAEVRTGSSLTVTRCRLRWHKLVRAGSQNVKSVSHTGYFAMKNRIPPPDPSWSHELESACRHQWGQKGIFRGRRASSVLHAQLWVLSLICGPLVVIFKNKSENCHKCVSFLTKMSTLFRNMIIARCVIPSPLQSQLWILDILNNETNAHWGNWCSRN